jgi:glycosyltransferase involved in cell wall biosynthesis
MRVSVIIPTYNYARYLDQAVRSVLAQTYPAAEILVVDDGSKDNTREVAESFGNQIRYIYQENAGPSAARNHGIREATGEWVAFLDSDDWWVPEKLELQAAEVRRDPEVAFVYCAVWGVTPDGEKQLWKPENPDRLWPRLRYVNCISGGSGTFIRRDALLAVGGFDEGVAGVADWECWVRLARKYRCAAVMTPLTMVRLWPESMSANHEKLMGETRRILEKTLISDLHGWRRTAWRRRIWSNQLFHYAVSMQTIDSKKERVALLESIREWPSPAFLPRRFAALCRNMVGAERWAQLRRLARTR